MLIRQPPIFLMTIEARSDFIDKMDKDLLRFSNFDNMSSRVAYWERRFALTEDRDEAGFKDTIAKHSSRVLNLMRAG